jgi:hypothetical protein
MWDNQSSALSSLPRVLGDSVFCRLHLPHTPIKITPSSLLQCNLTSICFSLTLDADVRVVVSASLRRMVPTVLRDLGREEADLCLSAFLVHIPSLMGDHAPIPQYTLRLLCEAIKASPHAIHVVTTRYFSIPFHSIS